MGSKKHGKANTFQRCLSGQQRTRASWRAFFKAYRKDTDENVWNAIDRFQDKVKAERLEEKHRKVLAPIDLRMEPIGEPSQDFTDWVWEHGMSFSRYGIYKETSKGKAEFECTHCQKTGIVDRSRIRLRNNEKGGMSFLRKQSDI